jgi:hypothetical protein
MRVDPGSIPYDPGINPGSIRDWWISAEPANTSLHAGGAVVVSATARNLVLPGHVMLQTSQLA